MGTPTARNVAPAGSEYAETVRNNHCTNASDVTEDDIVWESGDIGNNSEVSSANGSDASFSKQENLNAVDHSASINRSRDTVMNGHEGNRSEEQANSDEENTMKIVDSDQTNENDEVVTQPKVKPIMLRYKKSFNLILQDLNRKCPDSINKLTGKYIKVTAANIDQHGEIPKDLKAKG
ncbi:hypothetical protein TNCV_1246501 [Trichonephila clavipes]|uniref:Uncharacterized protein n=1 Tax=Trichonephila clavipes TaxID=2585209 RepID=A0A8X6RAT9_TRICX|nr:hypothetical protein TNCV_1246501 [Trichonephila clavipes]